MVAPGVRPLARHGAAIMATSSQAKYGSNQGPENHPVMTWRCNSGPLVVPLAWAGFGVITTYMGFLSVAGWASFSCPLVFSDALLQVLQGNGLSVADLAV